MRGLFLGLTMTTVGSFYVGFRVGEAVERDAGPCIECCAEGELCENEEEWARVLLNATHDKADAVELSRMVDECWEERNAALLDSTAAALVLQHCRGKLKVYELDAPP